MTTSTRLEVPAPGETWFTFASRAVGLDPGETMTPRSLRAALPPGKRAGLSPEPEAPPITIPELPLLSVESTEAPRGDSTDADFTVTGVLGEGGMGRVLLARQRSLKRDVALKVLKDDAASRAIADTLLAEAIVTGSIEHPSIVPIHALGRDAEGRPVLVMKRIEGVSWRDLVRAPDHPAWSSIAPDEGDRLDAHLDILMSVCNAAHFAHCRGIVHRDIKLANVMIGGFGEVYVVDWGIAMRVAPPGERDTQADEANGPPIGTPSYMAPEMALGERARIDARTDVYLLGATLHAILTGKPRHTGESMLDVLLSARASFPFEYGLDVPAELASICNRAMSAAPEARFSSALEMRQALSAFRRHRGSITLGSGALARLAEIDALLTLRAAGEALPGGDRRVHQWMTECRFAFMQALDAWKGNRAARDGLDRCLERMVEFEIAQRDEEGARALYAELAAPRPLLWKRIEALAIELAAAVDREARLRSMERDVDLSLGARAQLAMFAVLPLFATFSAALVYGRGIRAPDQRQLIFSSAVLFTSLLVMYFVVRRRLPTVISRRAAAVLLLLPAATLFHRVITAIEGSPLALTLSTDLIIAAVVTGAMGITVLPSAVWVVAPCLLGAIAMARWPGAAVDIFAGTAVFSILLWLAIWIRSVRARAR